MRSCIAKLCARVVTQLFQENLMQHFRVVVVVALAAGLALVAPTKMTAAPPAAVPTVTVSGVTATSPVLQTTSQIDVNATVTATFDTSSSGSSTDSSRSSRKHTSSGSM